ncbi:NAD(P)H-binding protein [Klenkia sp. LSe6-5]|uniref:NAD(P)H-binding protein n=1 Tax=Klenkia sesuvii TaxID=3103137 RepID=A0ABU8DT93_9ACTN
MTGASGFVGGRLAPALVEEGHRVRAMTRRPDSYRGAGEPVAGDVSDEGSLRRALEGCEAAYYLVHSLGDASFVTEDAAAARAFGRAAAAAGVRRIVYLGGLGDDADDLSDHLRSRREVERLLGEAGVPVTVLRAGIVVGHGGVSWEMTRQLVAHLPAMVTPRWVHTRTQPIAVDDVVRYLVGVLEAPEAEGRVFEVGGPDVLEYLEMLTRVAEIQGRHLFVLPVPLLSPRLSSHWLSLVTDVDLQTGRNLIDSMSNEVVVRDDAIRQVVPFEPVDYDTAVLQALGERARERRAAKQGEGGRRRHLGLLARGARA